MSARPGPPDGRPEPPDTLRNPAGGYAGEVGLLAGREDAGEGLAQRRCPRDRPRLASPRPRSPGGCPRSRTPAASPIASAGDAGAITMPHPRRLAHGPAALGGRRGRPGRDLGQMRPRAPGGWPTGTATLDGTGAPRGDSGGEKMTLDVAGNDAPSPSPTHSFTPPPARPAAAPGDRATWAASPVASAGDTGQLRPRRPRRLAHRRRDQGGGRGQPGGTSRQLRCR